MCLSGMLYPSVTCTIKIQLPSPLAQALYLARQHYRRTVPSEDDNNRIIDVRENGRRSHETQSTMGTSKKQNEDKHVKITNTI
jgi:hypothetical protein